MPDQRNRMSSRGAGLSWIGRPAATATTAPQAAAAWSSRPCQSRKGAAERDRRDDARADLIRNQNRWAAEIGQYLCQLRYLRLDVAPRAREVGKPQGQALDQNHAPRPGLGAKRGGELQRFLAGPPGHLGGAGLGGGAGLWMATHLAYPWIASGVLGMAILLCALPLLALPGASRDHRRPHYVQSLLGVASDVWSIARSRAGFLALLIFILPLGTGTAANLMPSIAGDWKASADLVALVSGVAGGLFATVGAIGAGFVCDRLERKSAYALFSIIQAACALAMAFAPHTPAMFVVFALAYAASNGIAYAGFSALTLETIGKGAAATKYNLLACFANVPVLYVAIIEGQVQTRWGSVAMLTSEAVLAACGLLVFGAVALVTTRRGVQSAVNATSGA